MSEQIISGIFVVSWIIVLLIFLFYFLTTVIFRVLSYKNDWHYFAGNQKVAKIDHDLKYYIIIPCYNEGAVIVRTLEKVLTFSKVETVIVDDDSSDNSVELISQINNPRLHLLRRFAPNAHTGKGDVLNFGLDYIRQLIRNNKQNPEKVIIGVIDADAQLADNALTCLDKYFSTPKTVIAQMRVKMYPRFKNMLQIFQDVEFFSVNHMAQIMRMYTHTVGLSGNGQFFRLAPVIKKIGAHPWGQALLDDYELTIRLMEKGITVDYMTDTYVYQEALTSVKKFIRQRSRWAQGDLDCLRYLPGIIKNSLLRPTQKLGIYYFLAQPWLSLAADIVIICLTALSGYHLAIANQQTSLLEIVIILGTILLISCLCGIIELILYCCDLHHFHELMPHKMQLLVVILMVSYVYAILFFSLVIAFLALGTPSKLLGQNRAWGQSPLKTISERIIKKVKKIKFLIFSILLLGLIVSQPVAAESSQTTQTPNDTATQTGKQTTPKTVKKPKKKVVKISAKSKRWVKKQLKRIGFRGNATIYANGKKVWSYTSANRVNSEYLINSVQKSLTAGIVMKQVSRGKLKLNNKLSKYYPRIPGAKKITILHLLRMTSGLSQKGSRIVFNKKHYNKWDYKDLNYVLLKRILEKVMHKKYTTLFYQTYKKPLKLKHTHYIWQRNRHLAPAAWAVNYASEKSLLGASGSTMSNGDLFKALHALMDGKILSKKEQTQLYNPPKKSPSHYCGGFYNHGKYRTCNGAGYGYYNLVRISKDGRQALIIQTNHGQNFSKYRTAANKIYHHLF